MVHREQIATLHEHSLAWIVCLRDTMCEGGARIISRARIVVANES